MSTQVNKMQELVSMQDGELVTTSKVVSDVFGKPHRDVTKAIKSLDCSDEFRLRNYSQSTYRSKQNKTLQCVTMTRDGFSFLCMGFTGKKAAEWKEAYINAFNQMERGLLSIDKEMQKLDAKGKMIRDAGTNWANVGHEIRRMKNQHIEDCGKLIDKVQFKLNFN